MSDDRHNDPGDDRRSQPADSEDGRVFSAHQARQGEIILRACARRIIFIPGLVGILVLAVVVRFAIG
ncbi:hypothetical protein MesoLj113c_44370 [Mesorhizobium sp. 113-3-9]|uniref:hypothetical protein n=1 Tax=Mesorhizobium sp. 113-3-9 TaxID=2744517 RepID=UPI0019285292|nr:hypothetical protein [Mesorhizobium sp. 113-3-9]BCG88327.1 hypothetical protein MesoLj113c_44370 [Mesorhizobium sp. 113-3-9]